MVRVISLACCSLCLSGCIAVNQGSRPLGSIVQTETMPEPGQWCRVTYPKVGNNYQWSQTSLIGHVTAVDDEGIHLSEVVVHGRSMSGTPVVSRLPYVGRYFKNTGVGIERGETSQVVPTDKIEQVEIISEQEGRQAGQPLIARDQNVAQQLVSAMPGRR